MPRQGSSKKKRSNSRVRKSAACTNQLRVDAKKQHGRSSGSELQSSGATRSPKTLKVFDEDLDAHVARRLARAPLLDIDTETDGLDYRIHKLRLIQLGTEDNRVYMVRNPRPESANTKMVLASPVPVKIFHHAAFDLRFIKAWMRMEPKGRIECTKTLLKIIHPEFRSGLGTALGKLFKVHLQKVQFDHGHWNDHELTKEQLSYAANDVLYLHLLLKKLKTDASWAELARYERAMKIIPEKAFMEVEGYTDLWDYPQIKHEDALNQRNWWLSEIPKEN